MKKLFFFAAVAATLVACSSSDPAQEAPKNDTIRLTTSVSGQTRATSQSLQTTQIANGQNVFVEYDATNVTTVDAGTPWSSTTKKAEVQYTADGTGALTSTTIVKWPSQTVNTTDNFDIKAWVPFTAKPSGEYTVKADQTADADYVASDYLYGTKTGVKNSDIANPVQITFGHMLTKINVNISAGLDQSSNPIDVSNAKVEFGPATTFQRSYTIGNDGAVTATATTKSAVTMTSALEAAKTASAIVVPQTVATGSDLLIITLSDNSVYKYTLPAAKTFDPGKVYTYNATVNGDGTVIIINEVITDWTAEASESVIAKP